MNICDVVIHVNESLGPQARFNLEERMRTLDGVIAPRFNERTPHLMIVAYDPDHAHVSDLINEVRRQGYTAQNCGGMSI